MSIINMEKIDRLTKSINKAKDFGVDKAPKKGFFSKLFSGFNQKSYEKELRLNSGSKNRDKNNLEALTNYLSSGGNPNAKRSNLKTPLIMSVNTTQEVATLLSYGADVNARDNYGKTLLDRELSHIYGNGEGFINENNKDNQKIVEKAILLMKNGANIDNEIMQKVLKEAALSPDNQLLKSVVQTVAEVNPKIYKEYEKYAEEHNAPKQTDAKNQELSARDFTEIVDNTKNEINSNEKEKENHIAELATSIKALLEKNQDIEIMPYEDFKKKLSSSNTEEMSLEKYSQLITKTLAKQDYNMGIQKQTEIEANRNNTQTEENNHSEQISPSR